jgi:hypothetical protein
VADAVAAEALKSTEPATAAVLGAPWRAAVRVRTRLRALGPGAEDVALRLLPTWRLPLDQLPDVAATLVSPSGGVTVAERDEVGERRVVAATSGALAR